VRLSAVVALAAGSLALAGVAAGHPIPTPSFVTAGQPETVTFVLHNERAEPMTGLAVTVPSELRVREAVSPGEGWSGSVDGRKTTWTGGTLPAGATSSFSLVLEATGEPGSLTLEAAQLYPGGDRVRWPVVLTILPGAEGSGGGSSSAALLVAGIGLLLAAGLLVVLWLRRSQRA
jgi:hypothetical protein